MKLSDLPRSWWVSTGNAGKLREIVPMIEEHFAPGDGLRLKIEGRAPREAEETESTFTGNAYIKARALVTELTSEGYRDFCVLSDDSGLAVDALGGRPGVHSARYAGDHVAPEAHMAKLQQELAHIQDPARRTARYHCALVLLASIGGHLREFVAEGTCEGVIGPDARGASGFGYDPIFVVPSYGKTMAELSYETKNSFSHRRRAFERLAAQFARP